MNWFLCLQLTRASPRPGIRGGVSSLLGSLASPVRPRVLFTPKNLRAPFS